MKPIILRIFLAFVLLANTAKAEVILQYFGTSWNEIERRMPELAERGYDSLWLPPPFKAGGGTFSVGYDTLDRFDLGDQDQSGTVPTKYGTKADLINLMQTAHRFGIRVYFDNVMAHTAGPLDSDVMPGELFPGAPGFVPEDLHIVRDGTTWRKPADFPDYNNEWEVLNRNPFSWDIAQENPNTSFNPTDITENNDYPKWIGIRHPDRTEWYVDTDLTVATNGAGDPVHPFADKEPFQDIGYSGGSIRHPGNGRFDFEDTNFNGQHDIGEASEPFSDVGVDPTVPGRQTANWGYGDGIYNMGDVVAEDVNQMMFRALRWFIAETKADGFRLDAVKHVPSYFFGQQSGADKDFSNAGYIGSIQEEFNISRGFSDWSNHRDTVFDNGYQARNDAMVYGEHLGAPPAVDGYLNAGMRIANDNLINTLSNGIGANLSGYDSVNYGAYGASNQNIGYAMSHDNNYLFSGDRPLAHAYILTREGIPIVYTDGYNQAGAPDYFPKPSEVSFLGQFSDNSVISAVDVHRDFARGYQIPRWSDQDYAAYERVDDRENKSGGSWSGQTMLFMMARNYQPNGQGRLFQTGFPNGATLVNQSPFGGKFRAFVNSSGELVDNNGFAPLVPANGWFAFTWHSPTMPLVWQAAEHLEEVKPIEIFQNGNPVGTMDHWRVDGVDGDPSFNPYGVPVTDTDTRSYKVQIPRVTDGSNLRFVARADGSAENIRMKLNGGIDINSQMAFGPLTGDLRDFPPGENTDQVDAANPSDTVLQASIDTYLGYEQMQFVRRSIEKFSAIDRARNIIGSVGAENHEATIGSAGVTTINGNGPNNSGGGVVNWVEHDPAASNNAPTSPVSQMNPAPELAADQALDLWVEIGYQFEPQRVWVYYTTDGSSYPEGSHGIGKGSTQVVSAGYEFNGPNDGTAVTDWWKATLPAMPSGTVLRYKIGVERTDVMASVFPFSSDDIDLAERAETEFEINNFDATSAPYHVHNDHSEIATGLEEGFHILRSRAFVGRTDGSSIFHTNTQVFYYDTQAPTGVVAFPNESDQLGGSSYESVVLTDSSVTEVWYYIEDLDPTNDNPATGNGIGNWVEATLAAAPSALGNTGYTKEWRFTYANIPSSGTANIVVRLKESSSEEDMNLTDEIGHYTTLTRGVSTGSSINFNIGFPSFAGETVDSDYVMSIFFKKELIPALMTDEEFLEEFSISISSTVSGQPDNPVFQPRSEYSLVRDATATEHSVEFTFPNLYNGMPEFLHTVRAEHQRGSLSLGDSEMVKMKVDDNVDADGDDLPTWWELTYGIQANNPAGIHGASGDFDFDGVTNIEEYLFGMNPAAMDAEMRPEITMSPHATIPEAWTLDFPTIPNRSYQWQASEDLIDPWQDLGNPVNTEGSLMEGVISRDDSDLFLRRFYRMNVTPSP